MDVIVMQYRLFQAALHQRGTAAAPNNVVTPRSLDDFRHEAMRLIGAFLGASHALLADPGARAKHLEAELMRIALFNVGEEIRRVQGAGKTPSKNLTGVFALLEVMRATQPENFFTAVDSAGRHWNAAKLVDVLVRDYRYQVEIDQLFKEAKEQGVDRIQIEDSSLFGGQVMSLAEAEERRSEIFHPNSRARFHAVSS